MLSSLSKRITDNLIKKGLIHNEDFELYHYGVYILSSELFLLLVCFIFGLFLKIKWQSIIFYASFYVLHRFAGGFHAKTEIHCQIITLSSFLLCMIGVKITAGIQPQLFLLMNIISCFTLVILSPSDTPQKPLTKNEKRLFKTISSAITLVLFLLTLFLIIKKAGIVFVSSLSFALLLEAISLFFGRLLNHRLLS